MNYLSRSFGLIACAIIGVCSAGKTSAAEMNLATVFSAGSVAPANVTGPWLNYSIQNFGLNTVVFTLTATGSMTDPEKISEFYFNFDDTLTVANLNFTPLATSGAFTAPTISKNMNGLKADGDGWYDLRLSFDVSGGLANNFSSGDSLSYLLSYTGVGTMTESNFEYQSQPGGSEGTYFAAAHIQSTPAGGSGSAWLGSTTVTLTVIPEPSTAALVGLAVAMLGARRRI